jgi:hypothetical protein
MTNTTITFNTDEIAYLVELLNNERYTANTNAALANTLIDRLVDVEPPAMSDLFSNEEIDAQIAYASVSR